jgi:hypothetical protein
MYTWLPKLKSLITSDIVESTSKIGHDGNESIFFRRVEPLEVHKYTTSLVNKQLKIVADLMKGTSG